MNQLFMAALNFFLSPVMAGHLPFKLSQLGVRALPKFLSFLHNVYICFAAVGPWLAQSDTFLMDQQSLANIGALLCLCCRSQCSKH